uniref:Uncharacterized protein n=1 Tax=Octopus bimaculoides TaxID=37653 RepID=A0A0L8GWM9_OCTBM
MWQHSFMSLVKNIHPGGQFDLYSYGDLLKKFVPVEYRCQSNQPSFLLFKVLRPRAHLRNLDYCPYYGLAELLECQI